MPQAASQIIQPESENPEMSDWHSWNCSDVLSHLGTGVGIMFLLVRERYIAR